MIEIYEDNSGRVTLTVTKDGQKTDADSLPEVEIYEFGDDTALVTDTSTKSDIGEYYYDITSDLTSYPRILRVVWTYAVDGQSFVKETYVEIVVPYTTPGELKNRFSELSNKSDADIENMERKARYLINAYTGVKFTRRVNSSIIVQGNDSDRLVLPKPVISFSQVLVNDSEDITNLAEIKPTNHWVIRKKRDIADDDIKRAYFDRHLFRERWTYKITGDFGWEYVPFPVSEAAQLLVHFLFSKPSNYRRHNVGRVDAQGMTLIFNSNIDSTGNSEVDRLLSGYQTTKLEMI